MKIFTILQKSIVVLCFILLGGLGGYYLGVNGYEIKAKKNVKQIEIINRDNTPDEVDFARFWEVWDKLTLSHIKRPLNPTELLDGAIHGMVAAVGDPYSAYLTSKENQEATEALNGKYEGIGAHLGFNEESRLIIVAAIENSPAQKAGLKSGDMIVGIEGKDTAGISIDEAVSKIRGPAGTTSTLLVYRKNDTKPFELKIERETITIDSVKWEDKGDGVAYIKLSRFGEDTNKDWTKIVTDLTSKMKNLETVVLDMRNNPGGFLESSIYIASEFVADGVVVKEDFSDGKENTFKVEREGKLTNNNVKLIVLINEGSASASEIVAGALRERRNATLVGKRSFGKGSVQKSESFKDGAALHITVAKWLTPDGNWIDKHNAKFSDSKYNEKKDDKEVIGGLKPDVEVEVTEEDLKNQKDPQLDKALELARS